MASNETAVSDSSSPSVDEFAEVLLQELEWYDLGVFLKVPKHELQEIVQNFAPHGNRRCLIELYGCLEKKGKPLSWEIIATALRRMGNNRLADDIHSNHILPSIRHKSNKEVSTEQPVAMDRSSGDSHVRPAPDHTIEDKRVEEVGGEFQSLTERFVTLSSKIRRSLKTYTSSTIDSIEELQHLIEGLCGIPPLPQDQATFEAVFNGLKQHYSILNFRPLIVIAKNLLSNEKNLQKELAKLTVSVERFKKSAKMVELVSLIQDTQIAPASDGQKKVKLKVREFWEKFTMSQFEIIMNEILDTLYPKLSHITVGKGCICVSWAIPDDHINATKLVPELPLEFVQIIGVISLHIGDTAIYNIGGEGCETIEAAMLQSIELKNTRAIELLLAVGCSPEVAAYHEDNAVTNIVNIYEKLCDGSGSGGVDHVCILGHNEHVEAIFDPSMEPQCSSCRSKEKIMRNLQQEIDGLRQQNDALVQQMKKDILEFNSKQGIHYYYSLYSSDH